MMARASGRRRFMAEITSRPLPSPNRISTTAKAGAAFSTWRRPSLIDSAVVTVKPRPSMARARRCRNDLSSSTISSDRSFGSPLVPASFITVSNPSTREPCPACLLNSQLRSDRLGLKWGTGERRFKIVPVPGHGDSGAMQRRRLIDQRKLGPGTLQKRLGDEKAKAKPEQRGFIDIRTARSGPAMGDIGRAEAIDHFGSKSRAVVANRDADLLARPSGGDLNAAVGEIHRVFDQIAEPITDCRIALAARFAGAVGRVSDNDRNPEITVWRHRLFDQCR